MYIQLVSLPTVYEGVAPLNKVFVELEKFAAKIGDSDVIYYILAPTLGYGNQFKIELIHYAIKSSNTYLPYSSFVIASCPESLADLASLNQKYKRALIIVDSDRLDFSAVSFLPEYDFVYAVNFPTKLCNTKEEYLSKPIALQRLAKLYSTEIHFPQYSLKEWMELWAKKKKYTMPQISGIPFKLYDIKVKLY